MTTAFVSPFDDPQTLDRKVSDVFAGKVVRKDLVRKVKVGAKRALIPIENRRNFFDVPSDIMEHVDPVFYGDPMTAAMKALGMK